MSKNPRGNVESNWRSDVNRTHRHNRRLLPDACQRTQARRNSTRERGAVPWGPAPPRPDGRRRLCGRPTSPDVVRHSAAQEVRWPWLGHPARLGCHHEPQCEAPVNDPAGWRCPAYEDKRLGRKSKPTPKEKQPSWGIPGSWRS